MCYGLLLHQVGHIIGILHQFSEDLAEAQLNKEQIKSDYMTQIHRELEKRRHSTEQSAEIQELGNIVAERNVLEPQAETKQRLEEQRKKEEEEELQFQLEL